MKYLRSKAKRLSLLALFALALQLGLSFGHCHHDVAAAAVPGAASASHTPAVPDTDHDHDAVHRDLCAICASMAMAHTVVAATAPPLTTPLTLATHATALSSESISRDSRRSGFRSRAPPLS